MPLVQMITTKENRDFYIFALIEDLYCSERALFSELLAKKWS